MMAGKVVADCDKDVLVAPHWPAQAWHAQLVSHASTFKILHADDAACTLLLWEARKSPTNYGRNV